MKKQLRHVPTMTTAESHAAAIKIQAQARGHHIRKMRSKFSHNDGEHSAAVRIQSLQRGRNARKYHYQHLNDGTAQETKAATMIQALHRGQRHRKTKTRMVVRGEAGEEGLVNEETVRQNTATTKIQSIQRGRASRRSNAARGGMPGETIDPLLGHHQTKPV
jgi:hypothetical protein